jgi:sialate O-acetylesterase
MQVGEGLKIKDKYGCLKGFTLAGQDKIFKWAKAELINKTTVSIYCPGLEKPVAVRYGWASNPDQANLYNSANLPTNPFRTDEWQVITFREK